MPSTTTSSKRPRARAAKLVDWRCSDSSDGSDRNPSSPAFRRRSSPAWTAEKCSLAARQSASEMAPATTSPIMFE
jgi:hypothetical protein